MSNDKKYAGRNAVLMPRASTDKQKSSIRDQLKQMETYAKERGINVVGRIGREGISGSKGWDRPDFDEILDRKKSVDDFDLLIVYDIFRFSRAGIMVGFSQMQQLMGAGIDILSSSDEIADGEIGEMQIANYFMMAKGQAKNSSKSICRGRQGSVADGRSLPFPAAPYGTDRFVRSADGRPLAIIRALHDRSQQVINPATNEVERTFPPRTPDEKIRYIKQKTDTVELCPGAPERVRVVLHIFRRRHMEGWGPTRIARELNQQKILTHRGKPWTPSVIHTMLGQSGYFGYSISNKSTAAQFYRCSKGEPVALDQNAKVRAGKEKPPLRIFSSDEWTIIEQPLMLDYIPTDIREAALQEMKYKAELRASNAQKSKKKRKSKSKDRHKQSPYLLKNVLLESTQGLKMSGTGGPKSRRYYRLSRAYYYPGLDYPFPTTVPAEPIEAAAMTALKMVLSDANRFSKMILEAVERHRSVSSLSRMEVDDLKAALERIDADCKHLHRSRGTYRKGVFEELMQENEEQYERISRQINEVEHQSDFWGEDVPQKVDQLTKQMVEVSGWITDGPSAVVSRMLGVFVASAAVDTTTKEFEISFRVPKWAFDAPERLSLETDLVYQEWRETKHSICFSLPSYVFSWDDVTQSYDDPVVILPAPPALESRPEPTSEPVSDEDSTPQDVHFKNDEPEA